MARYKNRRTKYSNKWIHGQKRFESREQKRASYLLEKERKNEGFVIDDKPIPLIDIGIERINELIKTKIDPNMQDFVQAAWERILNSNIVDEKDVIQITENVLKTYNPNNIKIDHTPKTKYQSPTINDEELEIILNTFSPKYDESQNNGKEKHKFTTAITINSAQLADATTVNTDPYLIDNNVIPRKYLEDKYNKCPKCGSRAIAKDYNDTICLNCGSRGYDRVDIISLITEAIIRWLIRNRPKEVLSPPNVLL